MSDRRGVALLLVLAASALISGLLALALGAVAVRARLVADARWQSEGRMIAAGGLARTRVTARDLLDTIADGAVVRMPSVARPDRWSWQATIARSGALVRIVVVARRDDGSGQPMAARTSSLLLVRAAADTVRVIRRYARH